MPRTTRTHYWSVLGVLWLAGWSQSIGAQNLPEELIRYADVAFFNGDVLTVDTDRGDFTMARAVAVRDGRILAVGTSDRILRLVGPSTRKIDLKGKAVMPGIINTHIHPNRSALRNYRQDVVDVKFQTNWSITTWNSKTEVLEAVERIVASADPEQEWITIAGQVRSEKQLPGSKVTLTNLNEVARSITKADLDRVSPDKPLVISLRVYHGLANSRALEIMLKRYGENLPGIVRDAEGEPTGELIGGIPVRVVAFDFIPRVPAKALTQPFKRELEEQIAPLGITTFSSRLDPNEIRAYMMLDMAGQMPLRLAYGHDMGRWNPLFERDMNWSMGVAQGFGTEKIWLSGISVGIPDGQPGSYVCSSFPRLRNIREGDGFPESLCQWDLEGDNTRETVRLLSQMGYRVSNVHSYGDGGMERALETFEEVGAGGRRFALDHSQLFNPRVIQKGGELGVYFSFSPAMFSGQRTLITAHEYGNEVADSMLGPVKALLDAGAKVTYEGEFDGADPMKGLEVLTTRKDQTGTVRGLKHAVDRQTALRIMTRWGAEYVLREDRIGSIEAGKFADLIVLDQNPLSPAVKDEDLSELKVLLTMVGGKVIYDSGNIQ